MTTILPPNVFNSDAPVALTSDEAVASQSSQAPVATADISCIGEIFVGARKLNDDHRFVLDVDRFMAELDEPPLFLRQAV